MAPAVPELSGSSGRAEEPVQPRRLSAWLLMLIAVVAPPLANAMFMLLIPHEGARLTGWLSSWGVVLLDTLIALGLAVAARTRMVGALCVVLVAAVGSASWLALALLMMAP
jgi:hypothetical protein